jgi:hypothetical protein
VTTTNAANIVLLRLMDSRPPSMIHELCGLGVLQGTWWMSTSMSARMTSTPSTSYIIDVSAAAVKCVDLLSSGGVRQSSAMACPRRQVLNSHSRIHSGRGEDVPKWGRIYLPFV